MKQFLLFILSIYILGICSNHIKAECIYEILDNETKTALVRTDGNGSIIDGKLIIPESVTIYGETYTVTKISPNSFNDIEIDSLIIPKTVKFFGNSIFNNCKNLRYVKIESDIMLPCADGNNNTGFSDLPNLEVVIFSSAIPPCGRNGLYGLKNSKNIVVDKKHIMNYASSNFLDEIGANHVTKLRTSTSDDVLTICSDEKFEYLICDETNECIITKYLNPNTALYDFVIPDKVNIQIGEISKEYKIVGIGPEAFGNWSSDKYNVGGTLTISNNIRYIGPKAFFGTSITNLYLGENVKVIDYDAFGYCGDLEEISFNKKLEIIGEAAFQVCPSIPHLELPQSALLLGDGAFEDNKFSNVKFNDSILYIGDRALSTKGATFSSLAMPDKLEEIGEEAFYGCSKLTDVQFGNHLRYVGYGAFKGTALTSVELPSSVQYLNTYAFYCNSLRRIHIKDGTTPLFFWDDTFYSPNIEYLYIGKNFSFPAETSFTNLQTLLIGNLVSIIPDKSFSKCPLLTNLTLGSGVIEIGNEAFKNCSISQLLLPSKLQKIGINCFAANKLTSITFGAGITEIGQGAFTNNQNIAKINIMAEIPPVISANTFANYDAVLFTDPRYSSNYNNSDSYWSRFKRNELKRPKSIRLNYNNIQYIPANKLQLTATIFPEDISVNTILWESSNPSVAVVDHSGLVTMSNISSEDEHSCKISAYTLYADSPIAECMIDESQPTLISSIFLSVDMIEGKEGEQKQINATILPEDATNKIISWSSSDENITTVNNSGLVSLLKKGTAVIKASATDGSGISAECTVNVSETAGIEEVLTSNSVYVYIFNMQGVQIYEGLYSEAKLAPDYYIIVCNGKNAKIKIE